MVKIVEKYQFDETQPLILNGSNSFDYPVVSFVAEHVVLKKKMILKRLTYGQEMEQAYYEKLINQIEIAKKIQHSAFGKCHKVLKTKNHIYFVYDHYQGVTLQQTNCNDLEHRLKIDIAVQLCSALVALQKLNLCHSQFKPSNIILLDNKVHIVNLQSAQQIPVGVNQLNVVYQELTDSYTAPQIIKGKMHMRSDIYSLGHLLMFLFNGEFQMIKSERMKHQFCRIRSDQSSQQEDVLKIFDYVRQMVQFEPNKRPSSKRIFQFFNKLEESKHQISDHSTNQNSPTKSEGHKFLNFDIFPQLKLRSNVKSAKERQFSFQKKPQNKAEQIQQIFRSITKKRNYSIFLLKLSLFCSSSNQVCQLQANYLSYIFFCKSYQILEQISKLLYTGKSDWKQLQQKSLQDLKSHHCYLGVAATINKQKVSMKDKIMFLNNKLHKNLHMEQQNGNYFKPILDSREIDDQILHQLANNFIKNFIFIGQQNPEGHTRESLIAMLKKMQKYRLQLFVCLCLIKEFGSYQKGYDYLCSSSGSLLKEQALIRTLKTLHSEELIKILLTLLQ